ncbi:MAG TPA: hypothetical protein VJU61_12350, partial [Polyangiaceae bacterium]|nr:hypothetical protein [Polyangiaceae bacterium]
MTTTRRSDDRYQALIAITAFGLLAAAALPSPSHACSLPPCTSPVRLFERGATVPGNLVYFKLLGGINVDGALQPLSPLSLETSEHEPIAASVRTIGFDRVFAPDQPIAPGTHVVLTYRPTCLFADEQVASATYEFTTSEAAEFEPRQPALEVARE